MIQKEELVALRKDNTIYRTFPNKLAMDYWFYSLQGSTLVDSFVPAKVTTIIEVLDNEQSS